MDVLMRVPGDVVCHDLQHRLAVFRFKLIEEHGWLIRAEVPMMVLLGYGAALSVLTDGLSDHWITFNRWEPVETDDGGSVA